MIRGIGENLRVFYNSNFPKRFKKYSKKSQLVYLGIGGNIGNSIRRFTLLIAYLKKIKSIDLIQSSIILKNPPFGLLEQDDFYNSILVIKTDIKPHNLLKLLLQIESRFGRVRVIKDGPRTLDIDILFIDNKIINTKNLQVPHPHWQKRESVLIPLLFMNSYFIT